MEIFIIANILNIYNSPASTFYLPGMLPFRRLILHSFAMLFDVSMHLNVIFEHFDAFGVRF